MKKKLPLIIFIIGLTALVAGATFLAFNFITKSKTADAEYLVKIGTWTEEDSGNSVIWTFSEIGKGALTTNSHLNDYDFIWAIEEDNLKIETDWLYTLNNNYTYTLDQANQKLYLTDPESKTHIFIPATTSAPVDIKTTE